MPHATPEAAVRGARADELDALAALWYEGWQDAHAALLPAELARVRTLESFRERLEASFHEARVTGPPGAPTGLCLARDDEVYQLFVARTARGTGAAAALLADAEARLRDAGVTTAWLACAIGNERAARFYEKRGWRRAGAMTSQLPTSAGEFRLEVWRFERTL